jgi:protocatechuate 3,4-dioxygenase beta subunit
MDAHDPSLDRRQLLHRASVLGLGAAAGLGSLSSLAAAEPALLAGGCTMSASQVEGPFYVDLNLVRRDITEGLPGIPLNLFIRVLDVDGCTPLPGAEVDVWHVSAGGRYSNIPGQGTGGLTWFRGVQFADANGIAQFRSVFPGWYPGRTTHIHAKVYPQTGWELNTQLYFNDDFIDHVYALPPYSVHGPKDTPNALDVAFIPEALLKAKLATDPLFSFAVIAAGITIVVDRP